MPISPSPRVVVGDHNATFAPHSHRPNLSMRDLGVSAATDGQIAVYIVRASKPFDPKEDIGMHSHTAEFQYFFVLKGWQKMKFADIGEVTIQSGNGWMQSGKVPHEVLDYSKDLEILCVNMPGKFDTAPA